MLVDSLGHYEILEPLGAGGMGEVYRARDTTLKREVAIKVLPEELATDPERRQRFEREAEAIAALDHPNIVTVFSVEEADTDDGGHVHFITMQLVEGTTLSELVPPNGFPLEKFFDLAIPLADAISAAHERGIVHRDLKPANIMVSNDGRVRVLDFGLAKLREDGAGGGISFGGLAAATDSSEAPTSMATVRATSGGSQPLTEEGKILGTVAYMSPEQAEGKPVDHRTDIFSLGIILYEMATGERPFQGDTNVSVISSIVRETPSSVTELNRNLPRHLGRIVKRTLAKDPDYRFQSAKDLRNDLLELKDEIVSGELASDAVIAVASRPLSRRVLPWGVAAVAIAALVASLAIWSSRGPITPEGQHFSVIPVEDGYRLSGGHEFENQAWSLHRPSWTAIALSPDGRHLAYAATDGGRLQLYRQRLDEPGGAVPIVGTDGGCCPFFSPDGQSIGFLAADEAGFFQEEPLSLKTVSLGGGDPRTIVATAHRSGATWGDDDTIVYVEFVSEFTGRLARVPATGGASEPLTEVDTEKGETRHCSPHLLPGASAVLFVALGAFWDWESVEIIAQSLETGKQTVVATAGSDPRYVPTGDRTGHLVYAQEGRLVAVPFDPVRLEITGDPVPVLENLMQAQWTAYGGFESGVAQFSFSTSGDLVYVSGGAQPRLETPLVWVNRDGSIEAMDTPPDQYIGPRVSRDGRYLAYTKGRTGAFDIWVYDIQRGIEDRLTSGENPFWATWSPDGERIAYNSRKDGRVNLYLRAADGTGEPQRLTRNDSEQLPMSWSPDGILAYFQDFDIWVLPIEGESAGEPRPFVTSPTADYWATFSPGGERLAYVSAEEDRYALYVKPYPGPGPITTVATNVFSPAWSPDGQKLYYQEFVGQLPVLRFMTVEVTADDPFTVGRPELLFEREFSPSHPGRNYDVMPDGRFVAVLPDQTEPQPATQIELVLNWFEELKQRVPTRR